MRKEQLNGYGVMAACGPEGERRTRGSGLYHQASLINHECNPNLARFDAFDGTSVRLAFRAMHDLPRGGLVGRLASWSAGLWERGKEGALGTVPTIFNYSSFLPWSHRCSYVVGGT